MSRKLGISLNSEEIRQIFEQYPDAPHAPSDLEEIEEDQFHASEGESGSDNGGEGGSFSGFSSTFIRTLTTAPLIGDSRSREGDEPAALPLQAPPPLEYIDLDAPQVEMAATAAVDPQEVEVTAVRGVDEPMLGPSTSSGAPVRASTRARETPVYYEGSRSSDDEVPEDDDDDVDAFEERHLQLPPRTRIATVEEITGEDDPYAAFVFPRKLVLPTSEREVIPWNANDQGPVPPLDFTPQDTGIRVEIPQDFDELQALMLFLSDNIWEVIARETNRYYQNREEAKAAAGRPSTPKQFDQKDVTPDEARSYVAIMILLGLNRPHNLRTPWKSDSTFRNDNIASMMSWRRFEHIHSNFHLVDNETLPPRDTTAYKLARVAPLLEPLQAKCRSVYKSKSRELSIDEGSLGWKGHSSMRQYNPNKPHKYHIKSYKLVESRTGYLSDIIIFDNTSRPVDEVVLTLLDNSPYKEHEGYSLFCDRFYTSPDLFWHLRTVLGFDATGTCLPNRHQFPQIVREETKEVKEKKRLAALRKKQQKKAATTTKAKGSKDADDKDEEPIIDIHSVTARKGEAALMAIRWKDKKDVFVLSTEATAELHETPIQRGRKTQMKPAVIPLYNKYMGGVDLNDYLESRYSPCRATRKLWRKLAMYLLSTAVTNAYIIHKMVKVQQGKRVTSVRKSSHFAFREKLGNLMLSLSTQKISRGISPKAPVININIGHLPKSYPPVACALRKAAENPGARGKPARQGHRCQMKGCNLRSVFYCQQCNKCLCVKPGNECFRIYHEQLAATAINVQSRAAAAAPPPVADAPALANTSSSESASADDEMPVLRRTQPGRSAKRALDLSDNEEPRPSPSKRTRSLRRQSSAQ
jgi:hypothetical protein